MWNKQRFTPFKDPFWGAKNKSGLTFFALLDKINGVSKSNAMMGNDCKKAPSESRRGCEPAG